MKQSSKVVLLLFLLLLLTACSAATVAPQPPDTARVAPPTVAPTNNVPTVVVPPTAIPTLATQTVLNYSSPTPLPSNLSSCMNGQQFDQAVTSFNDTEMITACISDTAPTSGSKVTVLGRLVVGGKPAVGATMSTVWHYATKNSTCVATTESDGKAICTRDTGTAKADHKVVVDIIFSYGSKVYNTSTSFTPR